MRRNIIKIMFLVLWPIKGESQQSYLDWQKQFIDRNGQLRNASSYCKCYKQVLIKPYKQAENIQSYLNHYIRNNRSNDQEEMLILDLLNKLEGLDYIISQKVHRDQYVLDVSVNRISSFLKKIIKRKIQQRTDQRKIICNIIIDIKTKYPNLKTEKDIALSYAQAENLDIYYNLIEYLKKGLCNKNKITVKDIGLIKKCIADYYAAIGNK